jgi:radical SAM superfamily enzyme YgiQ (UPF0313 family)
MRFQEANQISIVRPQPEPLELIDGVSRSSLLCELIASVGRKVDVDQAQSLADLIIEPERLKVQLQRLVGDEVWVHVTGPVENRVAFLGVTPLSGRVASFGASLPQLAGKHRASANISADLSNAQLGHFSITEQQRVRLSRPRTLLAALYHPENFPLPRFPLGISDLARALRDEWLGELRLLDMQFGETIDSIVATARDWCPELIGISATFGQFDLLETLLDKLSQLKRVPLVAVGGSLGVLVGDDLLRSGKAQFIATGAGELTIVGLAEYVLGARVRKDIPDVTFWDPTVGMVVRTSRTINSAIPTMVPELDLLPATLDAGGVMQLETSRGCSYACSFCPRQHKGMWAGEHAGSLSGVLPAISAVFRRFPQLDRRIFLVDEEFVGYQEEELALGRCMAMAGQLAAYGFRFETSSRVDQVYRPRRDKAWHLNRMRFWRELTQIGLARCLFGVESGVDSILERFNKKTTAQQNVRALRLLSLLSIPIRCTYITFDPLMTIDELGDTLAFLARTDLLLRPPPLFRAEDLGSLYDLSGDDLAAAGLDDGVPFYRSVSYMGVSMEALIGSKYLHMVEEAGLAGELNQLMGRREVTYRDPRIGSLSVLSQYWVDRNFSLDYTLKGLEKCARGRAQQVVRKAREKVKDATFSFIRAGYEAIRCGSDESFGLAALEHELELLKRGLESLMCEAGELLPVAWRAVLDDAYAEWKNRDGWRLINGVCVS